MRYIILISILLFFPWSIYSQSQVIQSKNDLIENIIEILIEKGQDTFVEFPELYENLSKGIPDDKDEKLILVEKLKNKGFKVIDWGRGNYPPLGPRIITVSLKNNNCDCYVIKIYYLTVIENEYIMTEKIKCKKANR
jgi:hypothetical protein